MFNDISMDSNGFTWFLLNIGYSMDWFRRKNLHRKPHGPPPRSDPETGRCCEFVETYVCEIPTNLQ